MIFYLGINIDLFWDCLAIITKKLEIPLETPLN